MRPKERTGLSSVCMPWHIQSGRRFVLFIKRLLAIFAISVTSLCALPADDSAGDKELLQKATFTVETNGAKLNFVLLNEKTVEVLFSGSSKYSMRARANLSTVFYVDGTASKALVFNPKFEVVQNGRIMSAKSISIKNFEQGPLEKGARIQGLLELGQKLNLYQPFKLKDPKHEFAEFQYDWDALESMKD